MSTNLTKYADRVRHGKTRKDRENGDKVRSNALRTARAAYTNDTTIRTFDRVWTCGKGNSTNKPYKLGSAWFKHYHSRIKSGKAARRR